MSAPRIGIVSDYRKVAVGAWRDLPAVLVPATYVQAVLSAGGRPVVIPALISGDEGIAAALEDIDGLLLIGGRDLDPGLYGEQPDPATDPVDALGEVRDAVEQRLLAAAVDRGVPVLGICRGAQMLNVTLGGGLGQRFDAGIEEADHRGTPGVFVRHAVEARPGTLLGSLLDDRSIPVSSYHHQAIDPVAAPLVVSATSEDGLIEAVERPDSEFCLGVLWHPEEDVPGEGRGVFVALVEAAERHRAELSAAVGTAGCGAEEGAS